MNKISFFPEICLMNKVFIFGGIIGTAATRLSQNGLKILKLSENLAFSLLSYFAYI